VPAGLAHWDAPPTGSPNSHCLERAAVQVPVDVAHATGNSGVINSTANLPTDSQYTGQPVRGAGQVRPTINVTLTFRANGQSAQTVAAMPAS